MTQEQDPQGNSPHVAGAKLDLGKPMAGLVLQDFGLALLEVSKVTTHGAKKYTPGGWLHVPDGYARYTDALCRHIMKEGTEAIDPDFGLGHDAHIAWNALARLELRLRGRGK